MKSFTITLSQLLLLREAVSFTVLPQLPRASRGTKPLAMVSRDQYMQPHFHAPLSPVTDMDRIAQCSQADSECDVEEMTAMIQGMIDDDLATPPVAFYRPTFSQHLVLIFF
jgi:hypothetical protein